MVSENIGLAWAIGRGATGVTLGFRSEAWVLKAPHPVLKSVGHFIEPGKQTPADSRQTKASGGTK